MLFFFISFVDIFGCFNIKLLEFSSNIMTQFEEMARKGKKQQKCIQLLD